MLWCDWTSVLGGIRCPPVKRSWLIRSFAFTYSPFKDPITLAFGSLRKEGLRFMTFSNGSMRRHVFELAGGFDEGINWGEDHSLFFRLSKINDFNGFLVFDPVPAIWRRTDISGGLSRRKRQDWYVSELAGRIRYFHAVVGHYFPLYFGLAWPLFISYALLRTVFWVWDPDNAAFPFGAQGRVTARFLSQRNITAIHWTFSTMDSRVSNQARLWVRVNALVRDGSIVLIHDNLADPRPIPPPYLEDRSHPVAVLPAILNLLKQKGLTSVTIHDLLES